MYLNWWWKPWSRGSRPTGRHSMERDPKGLQDAGVAFILSFFNLVSPR